MSQSPFFVETRSESPDAALLSLVRNARERAEGVLARAEVFRDSDAREMMFRIAWSYEKLARRLEKESGGTGEA
jgi:hypothetical protein